MVIKGNDSMNCILDVVGEVHGEEACLVVDVFSKKRGHSNQVVRFVTVIYLYDACKMNALRTQ